MHYVMVTFFFRHCVYIATLSNAPKGLYTLPPYNHSKSVIPFNLSDLVYLLGVVIWNILLGWNWMGCIVVHFERQDVSSFNFHLLRSHIIFSARERVSKLLTMHNDPKEALIPTSLKTNVKNQGCEEREAEMGRSHSSTNRSRMNNNKCTTFDS